MKSRNLLTLLGMIYLAVMGLALRFGQVTEVGDNLANALVRFYTGV